MNTPNSKKARKIKIFSISLAQIRLYTALANTVLFGLALGLKGNSTDYILLFSYLFLNLIFLIVPAIRYLVTRPLRFLVFSVDLILAGYLLVRTGGLDSPLYPFLFIPVLVAVLRFRYRGILIWCTLMALMLTLTAIYTGTAAVLPLAIKTGYLYLVGIIGGYIISHTYMVNEEIFKKLARWNIELERINSFSHQVRTSSDLDEIFQQTVETIFNYSSSSMAALMILDETEELKIYAHQGWEKKWLESYQAHPLTKDSIALAGIIGYRNPLICSDIKKHKELVKVFTDIPVESLFGFPLATGEEVVGVLMLTDPAVRTIPEQEYRILESIANQAGIAIHNVTSFHDEKRKAYTDGLTGLNNRRFFNERIEDATSKALAEKGSLSLIMVDIDDFKKYNDTYGHPEGDLLLKIIAGTMERMVREQDIVARYGGEEFAVILSNTNNATAMQIAERIRQSIADIFPKFIKSPVTISAGVATFPEHAKDRDALITFADKSLYQAKESGKNKVCCGFNTNSHSSI
jgi:diguanylate cyclase (GGDEF)-like protein